MKNVFLFLPLFFLCIFMGNAQETTIKHTVEKGETVFQLSRKYNVSPEDIYALNPSAVNIIKIGEVLSIPRSKGQNQSNTSSNSNVSNSNTITYAVVYGDTKYSLARQFGISIEEFERQNPHTKTGLQAGHILKIQGQKSNSVSSANYSIKKTHLVLKGQTLWGISKENNLSVEQLVNANSDILNGILQIGQVLKIPEIIIGSNSETYIVQKGDTKYGLSKKYGITIIELEKANPHIIKMLQAGHIIRLSKKSDLIANETSSEVKSSQEEIISEETPNVETVVQSTEISSTNSDSKATSVTQTPTSTTFVDYEIKPKETLYGLSKKAGMSISDFVTLNSQLTNSVQVGMIVKMPSNNSNQNQTVVNTEPIAIKLKENHVDLRQSIKTIKKNQLLLFLPFSESKFNDDYKQNISFNEISDEFIKNHLEFYRGAKIAQDSAKSLGLDFDLKIIETGNSKRNTNAAALAIENTVENSDVVLMPFYENDTEEIAELVRNKNIPVVTIGTIAQKQGLKNIYNSVPSLNSKRDIILDYLNSKGGNLIVVCDIARKESKAYISKYAPDAKFIEVSKKGTFDAEELVSQFDNSKVNYVILESDKNSVFLSTTNLLLGQLSNYSIQLALLDKSLIPNTDDVSKKRFVILQMLYPSLTPLNESSLLSSFIESYKKKYSVEPTQNVKFGFDLTFDALLRISQAKSFEVSAENEITEYTTLKFDYKINEIGSHDNNGIYIIQYNTDATLKEVK